MKDKEIKSSEHPQINEAITNALKQYMANGKIDEKLINFSPVEMLDKMGQPLDDDQREILSKLSMSDVIKETCRELGKADKRFLKAIEKGDSNNVIQLMIPVVGVVVAVSIAAVVIKAGGPKKKIVDDPNEAGKL